MAISFGEDIFSEWREAEDISKACQEECNHCNDSTPNACKSCRRMVKELLIRSNEKLRDFDNKVTKLLLSTLK